LTRWSSSFVGTPPLLYTFRCYLARPPRRLFSGVDKSPASFLPGAGLLLAVSSYGHVCHFHGVVHERAAGYPHDSSGGKAARAGSSENLEHLLQSGVWMRSTPNTSPISWPITLSGAPSTGRRLWWASWQRALSRKSVGSVKQGDFPIGAVTIQPDHVHLFLSFCFSICCPCRDCAPG
jgi:hypothetical protein